MMLKIAPVVEGVSSMRTELGPYWDLAVWVTCSYKHRLERGILRDGVTVSGEEPVQF
jgi:hypothetical protein